MYDYNHYLCNIKIRNKVITTKNKDYETDIQQRHKSNEVNRR